MTTKEFFKPTIGKILVTAVIFIALILTLFECLVFDASIQFYCSITLIITLPFLFLSAIIGKFFGLTYTSIIGANIIISLIFGLFYSYILSAIIVTLFNLVKNKIKK